MQKIDYIIIDKRMRDFPLVPSTKGSAAIDLRACIDIKQRIYPSGDMVFGTGIAIHIKDPGLVGLVVPRSGLGIKHGIVLKNLIGVIDSDYQGDQSLPVQQFALRFRSESDGQNRPTADCSGSCSSI